MNINMGRLRNIAEEEMGRTAGPGMTRGCRRKGIGTSIKKWMVVSETGESRVEDIDKHTIMRRTGLPARDLRVLDPMLSHPSSILGREKAIVVNLEHIKAIITANEVLMINSSNPFFLRFVHDLQGRVPSSNNEFTPSGVNDDVDCDREGEPLSEDGSPSLSSCNASPNNVDVKWGNPKTEGAAPLAPKQLPFEFRALEACIESACTCLESEVCIFVLFVYKTVVWMHAEDSNNVFLFLMNSHLNIWVLLTYLHNMLYICKNIYMIYIRHEDWKKRLT